MVLAGGATGVALATGGGPAPAAASSAAAGAGTGTPAAGAAALTARSATPRAHRGSALRRAVGLLARVEHGVLVVRVKGGTQTLDVQRGMVTSISQTGVTLRSADGFVASYALTATSKVRAPHPAGTKPSAADVHDGYVAEVVAVQQGGTADVRWLVARPVRSGRPRTGVTPSSGTGA